MLDRERAAQRARPLLQLLEAAATALAGAFDLLLRHPASLGRLRVSLEAGEDAHLKATIAEALRLRPVIPLAGRRLVTEVSGVSTIAWPMARTMFGIQSW